MNSESKIIRPFGPSFVKIKIPDDIFNSLNTYIDKIIENKKKAKELDFGSNLAGEVTQEFALEQDFMESIGWKKFFHTNVEKWIDILIKKKITIFNIENSWVVRQFENEYNPTHWHKGHISGVGYLKVPSNLGKPRQQTKIKSPNGTLQLVHGAKMFLSESTYNIEPKVGDMYLFPNYLMHLVFPFSNSEEERRSISFNAKINDEIYDTYGN